MPFIKKHNNARQIWKDWDMKANKQGLLHTVYFSNGNEYTGEWQNNTKHGKGIHVWKNKSVYNGDWKNDLRDGFGTLSTRNAKQDDVLKRYSGEWMKNQKHGYGICNFGNSSFYEGEWLCNKRHGWGKMVYSDSSIYEGEWKYGKRSGQGILKYANGNRYEGEWQNNLKNGFGKFFYYEKGQMYEGIWVNDVAKCGEIVEFEKEFVTSLTIQAIPEESVPQRRAYFLREGTSQLTRNRCRAKSRHIFLKTAIIGKVRPMSPKRNWPHQQIQIKGLGRLIARDSNVGNEPDECDLSAALLDT